MTTSRYQPAWAAWRACRFKDCHYQAHWWGGPKGRQGPLCCRHASMLCARYVLVPLPAHQPTEGWLAAREQRAS